MVLKTETRVQNLYFIILTYYFIPIYLLPSLYLFTYKLYHDFAYTSISFYGDPYLNDSNVASNFDPIK